MTKHDYYVPRTKTELIAWFVTRMGYTVTSLKKFPYKQLLAIYHKARQREDSTRKTFEVMYELSS